jgi:hypothetical protein
MQNYEFMLGVNWLRVYSPILFYFIKMKISFKKEGKMTGLKRKGSKKFKESSNGVC